MDRPFESLSTVVFQQRMKAAALTIYDSLFPGCHVEDLREQGVNVHILDKEFGVDSLISLPSGQWISIQEKYRRHKFLIETRLRVSSECPDFTQEFKNAVGTQHEANGEWFKLGAQLYFYGWANADETHFAKWVLMDIARYKLLVEQAGGLNQIGRLCQNNSHGRASFYAIPIYRLQPAWVATHAAGWLEKCSPPMLGKPCKTA